jgi:hypothetical protein
VKKKGGCKKKKTDTPIKREIKEKEMCPRAVRNKFSLRFAS